MPTIPFISRLPIEQQRQWCVALNAKMKYARVAPAQELTDLQAKSCLCAIVANPDKNSLMRFSRLVWVQSLWAGVDSLLDSLNNPTFKISRLVDPMLATTMAEAVLTWSLFLHRKIPQYLKQQNKALWRQHLSVPASERTVAVLGLGELGKKSVELLSHVGFNVVGWSRQPKQIINVDCYAGHEGLLTVSRMSDIFVILVPLTKDTYGLFSEQRFKQLKKGSAVINFARGGIVNNEALIDALDCGQISHAVLDVFEQEPLPVNSPLWKHPNITVTPHVSAPTNMITASALVSQQIDRYLETGELPNIVDLSIGY